MLVLVVEDEALIAWSLKECLIKAGHTVLGPAARLSQAFRLVADAVPDLALIDVRLADGSGADCARELKRRWSVPSLFLTASPELARNAQDAALGMLQKPFHTDEVIACVRMAERLKAGLPITDAPPRLEVFSAATAS